jgi:hypothetical protein
MFKTLYLVDQSTLDRIQKAPEERPALSYAEIYDSIIACEKKEPEKKPLTKWIPYRWHGQGAEEAPAGS